jgi:hypothetical protein
LSAKIYVNKVVILHTAKESHTASKYPASPLEIMVSDMFELNITNILQDTSVRYVEVELRRPSIMAIRRGEAFEGGNISEKAKCIIVL